MTTASNIRSRPPREELRTLVLASELRRALALPAQMKVVLFSQPACPACRVLLSHIRQVAKEHADSATDFTYIELSRLTADAFETHAIERVPTLAIFDESGACVDSMCAAATLTYEELCATLDGCGLLANADRGEESCELPDVDAGESLQGCDDGGPCEITWD